MKTFIKLGLALIATLIALPIALPALAGEAPTKSHYVVTGDTADVTTFAGTTAALLTYLSADQTEEYDAQGDWAIGTADTLVWCWTESTGHYLSKTFKVSVEASFENNDASVASWLVLGQDTDATVAAGDEISPIHAVELTLDLDDAFTKTTAVVTVSDGDCVGVLGDTDGATDITVHNFTFEAEQLD